MPDNYTVLNPGVGGDTMDESAITYGVAPLIRKRPRVVIGGDANGGGLIEPANAAPAAGDYALPVRNIPGPPSSAAPVVLYDAAGVAIAVQDGVVVPVGQSYLPIMGTDGANLRAIKTSVAGHPIVDQGVAGASAWPISAASLPLPAGAATEATLATRATEATLLTRASEATLLTRATEATLLTRNLETTQAAINANAGAAADAAVTGDSAGTLSAKLRGELKILTDVWNTAATALKTEPLDILQTIATTGLWRGKTAYIFNILGRRAGFTSSSVLNDVKEFDNAVAAIPNLSNSTLDIISSSVNDTNAAGTGVRKVKVVYVNNVGALVESADINLNGTTLVTIVLTNVNEVLWMEATDVGSGTVAAGNIRLRINGGTVECEQITAGGNKSLSARMLVPTGYTAYLVNWHGSAINNDQDIRLRAQVNTLDKTLSTVFHFVDNLYIPTNSSGLNDINYTKVPAGAKIKVSTLSAGLAGTVRADVGFTCVLIAN